MRGRRDPVRSQYRLDGLRVERNAETLSTYPISVFDSGFATAIPELENSPVGRGQAKYEEHTVVRGDWDFTLVGGDGAAG